MNLTFPTTFRMRILTAVLIAAEIALVVLVIYCVVLLTAPVEVPVRWVGGIT